MPLGIPSGNGHTAVITSQMNAVVTTPSNTEFWLDAATYHSNEPKRPLDGCFIKAADLAHVRYSPAHHNPAEQGQRAGAGNNDCIWIANEQAGQAEQLSQGGLDGLIDSYLAPHASIGWHTHRDTEEYYYLLCGRLYIDMEDQQGHNKAFTLLPGDRHHIGPGMSHCASTDQAGARFIAVILKCQESQS